MKVLRFFFFGLLLLASGCTVGPDYHPPDVAVPNTWVCDAEDAMCREPPVDWWRLFNDDLLNCYIEAGAFFNNDILKAEAAIAQSRALRIMSASQLFPQVTADFNATKTYFSKNGPVFAITQGQTSSITGLPFQIQIPQIQNLYTALIEVTWEIDLFGKIRRGVEAADAAIGASIEYRNDVLISVLAEIARNYIEIRSFQKRGMLIEENIELLEKNAFVVKAQLEKGYVNRLDLEKIEAELAQAQSNLPQIVGQIYQRIYALSVLTGRLPEALLCELLPIAPLPKPPCELALGLRSDLLRRRPDVRQAERELAEAVANIGVAVASFFPSLTLSGDIGFQSLHLNNLFQAGSKTWALGADINMPIFQGGNLIGNLRLSEANAASAAFTFQQTVLRALEEAEGALAAFRADLQASTFLAEAVVKNKHYAFLVEKRNEMGLVNVIDVIDSIRDLNASEQTLLDSETSLLIDIITIYKALGGGWQPVEPAICLDVCPISSEEPPFMPPGQ